MKFRFALLLSLCLIFPALAAAGDPHAVGGHAPPLDLQQLLQAPDGAQATWPSLRGQVVVLEFWATWCPSCIKTIPHLNELADGLKDQPVQFISVTDENKETILPFLAKTPIRGWVGLNTTKSMFSSYNIDGRPMMIVIRPNGILDARLCPWATPFPLKAENLLNLLAGKPSGLVSSRIIYAGEVHDQTGAPIANVSVQAINPLFANSWRQIGDVVTTDPSGHFRIDLEYPPSYFEDHPIRLNFKNPNFSDGWLEDLRLFSTEQQANLHIALRRGTAGSPATQPASESAQ
jgi:thiol-disulfide isomerase/thioredoxin